MLIINDKRKRQLNEFIDHEQKESNEHICTACEALGLSEIVRELVEATDKEYIEDPKRKKRKKNHRTKANI